ncbi:MAG: ribonuclease III domain-containing protein [Cyanobacteriota bacterium]|nr:ribonuclease III domain-containing protein [Cyanobacteriota bacterium]
MVNGLEAGLALDPLSPDQAQALSPVALAYIGDAVYELFVRQAFLFPAKRIQAYHRQVVHQVRAEQQSRCLDQLLPWLTPVEQDILRRGRNASPRGPKRLEAATYQRATGFEAVIGYLYLTDPPRLRQLLHQISFPSDEGGQETALRS